MAFNTARLTLFLATAVTLLCAPLPTHSHRAKCGLDTIREKRPDLFQDAAIQERQHNDHVEAERKTIPLLRRKRGASNTAFHDPRFAVQDDQKLDIPHCLIDEFSIYGSAYSECYFEEVTKMYADTTNWPEATLDLNVVHLRSTGGSELVSVAQLQRAVSVANVLYSGSNITFGGSITTYTSNSLYSKYASSTIDTNNFIDALNEIMDDFSVPQDPTDRNFHALVFPAVMDESEFVGFCFPEARLLALRSNTYGIPSASGAICVVDYRWFRHVQFDSNAPDGSYATTLAHELGHALGLWHTHENVPTFSPSSGNCFAPSSCSANKNEYKTGDYADDTEPMPNMIYIPSGDGSSYFDTDTCSPGINFPANCKTGSDYVNVQSESENVMSYFPEVCYGGFSAQQIGRMKCFIDRYIDDGTGRRVNARETDGPVLVYPTFESYKEDDPPANLSISVDWFPPLNLLNSASSTRSASLPTPSDLRYRLSRSPAFAGGDMVFSGDVYSYTDRDVSVPLDKYRYQVVAYRVGGNVGAEAPYVQAFEGAWLGAASLLPVTVLAAVVTFLL